MSARPLPPRRKPGGAYQGAASIFLLVLGLFAGYGLPDRAFAGQIQTIPSQQNPAAPPAPPAPLTHQPSETIPANPVLPGPQGNTRELPLPEVFRGCWSGDVAQVDSIEPLSPDARQIIWLTKSYTLCYKQIGYGARWHLTFAEGSVANRGEVSDQRQMIKVKSVSGTDRAQLTAYLHFRAPVVNVFGAPTGIINTLDELTDLDCLVMSADGVMDVRAAVFVENDDRPYARIIWHARLRRTVAGGG